MAYNQRMQSDKDARYARIFAADAWRYMALETVEMIDREDTYTQFEAWLEKVCDSEKPGSDIVAYNFGLFEGENGYYNFLTGITDYDEEDPHCHCNVDFVPNHKYYELSGSAGTNWHEIQAAVEVFVKRYISAPVRQASFLSIAQVVTVGFDDGDLVKVH